MRLLPFAKFIATATLMAGLTQAAQAADQLRWFNDWLPSGDSAAIYLGVQNGTFAKAGIDLTIQNARGSSDAITKLATGVGDVGTGGLAALLQARADGEVPVKAVMSIYTKQPDLLLTTSDAGIASLKDLPGKTVATATFSSSNVLWPLVLKRNGVDPAQVQLLKVDPGALAPLLATGKVQGAIIWLPTVPVAEGALKEAGKTPKALLWSDYGLAGYGNSVFASEALIAQHPDVLKRFLAAYKTAIESAIADPKAAAQALKAMVPEVDADVAEAQFNASIPLIENDVSKKDGLGAFEPSLLGTTWEWVAEAQGLPKTKLDPATAVDTRFAGR